MSRRSHFFRARPNRVADDDEEPEVSCTTCVETVDGPSSTPSHPWTPDLPLRECGARAEGKEGQEHRAPGRRRKIAPGDGPALDVFDGEEHGAKRKVPMQMVRGFYRKRRVLRPFTG
ncbi:MAG: hypothetical protein ACNA8W_08700 [Bradymonadaceae bacterium]